MTKEREMGQRAQKGVDDNSSGKSKSKSSNEKISSTGTGGAGDIESSEVIPSSGTGGSNTKKIEQVTIGGTRRNNDSPEPGGGRGGGGRQQGGGGGGGTAGGGGSGRGGNNGGGGRGGANAGNAARGSNRLVNEESTSRSVNGHQQSGQQPRDQRQRCRCWCCCCSCSCAMKGDGNRNKESTDSDPICDGDPLPSLEEIRSWGDSFDRLMRSPGGRKVFRDFLKCEYSEENILFWLAVEELKKEARPEAIEEKARLIYEDYISILSPKEVSLDSRVREIVNQNMVDPNPHTFDEAQMQIYTLMHRDSYPRFVNSAMYKKLAQLNSSVHNATTSSTGGSTQQSPSAPERGSVSNTASRKQSIAT